jgi:hypothetical protein
MSLTNFITIAMPKFYNNLASSLLFSGVHFSELASNLYNYRTGCRSENG